MSFAKGAGLAAAEAADSRDYNENYSVRRGLRMAWGLTHHLAPLPAPGEQQDRGRPGPASNGDYGESGVKPGMTIHRVRRGWIER